MKGRRSARRRTLTVRNVPSLPAEGARETLWWDDVVPGLFLSVSPPSASYPEGVRAYGVLFRVRGKQRRPILDRIENTSLAEVRDRAREVLSSARRGVDITERPWKRKGGPTLVTLLDSFIAASRKAVPRTRTDRTLAEYERMIDVDIRDHEVGTMPLPDVGRREMRALLRPIAGRAPVVAERMRRMLRAAFNWALDEDPPLTEKDPTRGVEHFAVDATEQRALRDDEIKILWRACEEDIAATMTTPTKRTAARKRSDEEMDAALQRAVLARWMLLTGARPGEALLMNGPELERGARLWHVPAEHRKGQRGKRYPHVFPVSRLALEVYDELAPTEGRVFTWTNDVKHWIDPLRKRAKARGLAGDWSAHDLRRTCSTGLSKLGYDDDEIALVLGHALRGGGAVTKVYVRFDRLPRRAEMLEAWGEHVRKVVS